jgi:hypothetical protein
MAARSREVWISAGVAVVGVVLVASLVPPAGDAPAHFYRTELLREGILVWDNLWYGGHYPFASYSLLYYPLAALVGNVVAVAAAGVAAAAFFASAATREWGNVARWPSRVFAVLATAPLVLGHYPYALGLAALLATLWALQRGRVAVGIAGAAVTLAFSPVAFGFLALILAARALTLRRFSGPHIAVAVALLALAGVQLAAVNLFPVDWSYFFSGPQLAATLATCAFGTALAVRTATRDFLTAFFVVWAAAALVLFLVPNPVGVNVTRLRWHVLPLVLVAAARVRFRPVWLAVPAVAFVTVHDAYAHQARVRAALGARTDEAAFWAPAVSFLRREPIRSFRVEVVPTGAHWEAYHLPRVGFPLARGWQRQIDLADNAVLYTEPMAPREYRRWLRARGVRYVVLPHVGLDGRGAADEAALLRSGRSGLRRAAGTRDWSIYELPSATPILTGPAPAELTLLEHDRVGGWTAAAGTYRLRIRYTPYWRVVAGRLCVARGRDASTALRTARPGRFLLAVRERPADVVAAMLGEREAACS